jgi:hypothetical protein
MILLPPPPWFFGSVWKNLPVARLTTCVSREEYDFELLYWRADRLTLRMEPSQKTKVAISSLEK